MVKKKFDDFVIGDTTLLSYKGKDIEVFIPNVVTKIASEAFCANDYIQKVHIPSSVQVIDDRAFLACSNLRSVVFSEGLLMIGDVVFARCKKLEQLEFPASLLVIGQGVLGGCNSLKKLSVREGNLRFHSTNNCIIETKELVLVVGCCSSVIPNDDSVYVIGEAAFVDCALPLEIEIPSNVGVIRKCAFFECSFKKVHIRQTVRIMGHYAFSACKHLQIFCKPSCKPKEWEPDWAVNAEIVWGAS